MTHQNFSKKNLGGFTIIEFVVYIAVLAILGGVTSTLFLWTLKAHTKTQVLQETTSSAQLAMDRVMYEIREAESLYLPTTTATQVSLKTKTSIPPGETLGYIDFFLCGEALCIKKEGEATLALTPNTVEVTNLSFTTISTDTDFPSLRVFMEVRHKNPNNRPELEAVVPVTSTASLR
ncbi:type II secretion system protein [Patescibacteria group bacterium]|nr:type II secretion system protein [Patescibacteria group bacterium]